MAPYQYVPLSTTQAEIRLLKLEPGAGPEIHCRLQHAFLDEQPPYEALSYTWGDASDPRSVLLDGWRVAVTANLEVALRHLRSETEMRTLWVDALCINQADLDEKARQVPKMYDVFADATTVLAWLGEASHNSREAMALMRKIGRVMDSTDLRWDVPRNDLTPERLWVLGFDVWEQDWDTLWDLWDRPYWTRMWVLQELVAGGLSDGDGKSRCLVGCGYSWIPRRYFDAVFSFLIHTTKSPHYIGHDGVTMIEPLRTLAVRGSPLGLEMLVASMILGSAVEDELPRSMIELLTISRPLKSTDVRDKIYALLGLAEEQDREFLVDYSKPADRTFMDLVAFLVQRDQRLDCILHNRVTPNDFGPSWIPSLTSKNKGSAAWLNSCGQLDASGGLNANVDIDFEQGLMSVRGVRLGEISSVIGPRPFIEGVALEHRQIRDLPSLWRAKGTDDGVAAQVEGFARSLPKDEFEHFWRTLVMDQDARDASSPITPAPDEFGALSRLMWGLDKILPPEDSDIQTSVPIDIHMLVTNGMTTSSNETLANRCFLTLADGKMGLGPYRSRVGDVVFVVPGASLCLVLRPKGATYELIGDAYVHGVMHGEAIREVVAGGSADWGECFTIS